jgi:sortase B
MFGKLDTFYRDTETYTENPYFYIYTEEASYKYLIFSYYVTDATSETYQLPTNEESYQNYKKYVTKQAVWKELDGIPDLAPIVTLSTCYGNNYTVKRFVVHGIMVNSK